MGIFRASDPDPGDAHEREETKDWLALPVVPPDTKKLDAWLVLACETDPGEQDRLLIWRKELSDQRKARLAKVGTAR